MIFCKRKAFVFVYFAV